MKNFVVVHKHCGCARSVEGFDIWDALKRNGLDGKVWIVQ